MSWHATFKSTVHWIWTKLHQHNPWTSHQHSCGVTWSQKMVQKGRKTPNKWCIEASLVDWNKPTTCRKRNAVKGWASNAFKLGKLIMMQRERPGGSLLSSKGSSPVPKMAKVGEVSKQALINPFRNLKRFSVAKESSRWDFLDSHHQLALASKAIKAGEGVKSPHKEVPNMKLCWNKFCTIVHQGAGSLWTCLNDKIL